MGNTSQRVQIFSYKKMNIFWGYNAKMVTIVNICIVYLKIAEKAS